MLDTEARFPEYEEERVNRHGGDGTMSREAATTIVQNASLRSPLRYPGGKSRVAKRLLAYAPNHCEYREPFVGGGALFFRKLKVERNWLSDLHPGLYALYVTLRDDFQAFASLCRAQQGDRRELFDDWVLEVDCDERVTEALAAMFKALSLTV